MNLGRINRSGVSDDFLTLVVRLILEKNGKEISINGLWI
jgi:hypothetical protein